MTYIRFYEQEKKYFRYVIKILPMKNAMKILWANALLILPMAGFSHPGHGHGNPLGPGHYLGNPEHAIPIALTIAAASLVAIWKARKARNEIKK